MFSFCVLPISRIGLKQRFTACSWCIDSWYARTAECWWWRWTLIHFHIKPFMNWPCGSSVGQLFNCAPYSVDCLQYCRSPRHLNKLMPRCLCTSQRCHNTHSKEEEKKPVSCRSQDIQWTVILDDIRCSCDLLWPFSSYRRCCDVVLQWRASSLSCMPFSLCMVKRWSAFFPHVVAVGQMLKPP